MANVKIAFIGAGSVRYTLTLISDLCKIKELKDSFLSLMDMDEERLEAVYRLSKRLNNELSSSLTIGKTKNLQEALDGASYVINTALARGEGHEDGYIQYEIMREIGEKYGYYRGIDSQEFNMVSDYYTIGGFNQLKMSLDIARAVERYSPNAYLLQTANPVFEITQMVLRQTHAKIIGFCHGYGGVFDVIHTLGLEPHKVEWQVAGVNHGIWLNRFLYQGENAYPLLDKWIEEKSSEWEPKNPWDVQLSPASIDMYRFYKMLPIGDTPRNGSWKYHYNLETKKKWHGKFGGIDNEVERPKFYEGLRALKRTLIDLSKRDDLNLSQIFPEVGREKLSGEQQIPFIDAIENNKKKRLILNIPNNGIISDIPKDIVVEVPVWVDKDGIHPENIYPDLTPRIKKFFLTPRIMRMEFALEAFITGDRRVLEEILIRDPRTKSHEQVKAVIEEVLNLPFNREMKEHYR